MLVKKLAITQIILASLLLASFYFVTWLLLESAPSIFNLYIDPSLIMNSNFIEVTVNSTFILYLSRVSVVSVFILGLLVLSCSIAQLFYQRKNTLRFSIVYIISGLFITGFSFLIMNIGSPLEFIPNEPVIYNSLYLIPYEACLLLFMILLSMFIFGLGLVQLLKTRKTQIPSTDKLT